MMDISGAEVGGQRSVISMMTLALFAQVVAADSPAVTIAMTLSGVSVISVGALIFKAGKWRGEHESLQKEVSHGFERMERQLVEKFSELREDIRDMRKDP